MQTFAFKDGRIRNESLEAVSEFFCECPRFVSHCSVLFPRTLFTFPHSYIMGTT